MYHHNKTPIKSRKFLYHSRHTDTLVKGFFTFQSDQKFLYYSIHRNVIQRLAVAAKLRPHGGTWLRTVATKANRDHRQRSTSCDQTESRRTVAGWKSQCLKKWQSEWPIDWMFERHCKYQETSTESISISQWNTMQNRKQTSSSQILYRHLKSLRFYHVKLIKLS